VYKTCSLFGVLLLNVVTALAAFSTEYGNRILIDGVSVSTSGLIILVCPLVFELMHKEVVLMKLCYSLGET
jgi:hypothetical protein